MTSRAESALALLAAANPVPDRRVAALVGERWSDHVLAGIVAQPFPADSPTRRLGRRTRRLVLAAAVLALLSAPTYAIARNLIDGWLAGEPAPPSVVANFDSYAPQLGFRPDAARAVVVAEDGDVSLYATTNDRGSYCLAAGAPDGGVCIPPQHSSAPLIAGIMTNGDGRLLVTGRAADPDARAIRFTGPGGNVVTRTIGSSGFFVAAVPGRRSPCANGDWRPTFTALGSNGEEVRSATITLARGAPGGVCSADLGPHP